MYRKSISWRHSMFSEPCQTLWRSRQFNWRNQNLTIQPNIKHRPQNVTRQVGGWILFFSIPRSLCVLAKKPNILRYLKSHLPLCSPKKTSLNFLSGFPKSPDVDIFSSLFAIQFPSSQHSTRLHNRLKFSFSHRI